MTWASRAIAAVKQWFAEPATPVVTDTSYSIGDPTLASVIAVGVPNFAGVEVNETSALSLSAVYRAVALIAGTIAGLPLRTIRDTGDGMRQRMGSLFDDPGANAPRSMTPFTWVETVVTHILLHGNAFLRHIYGGAGQLIALEPIHPLLVFIELPQPYDEIQPVGGKWFRITLATGENLKLDATDLTHIFGLSLNGLWGMSVIAQARNGFGTALAGDRAAARMFANGALVAGMVVPDGEDVDEDEAKVIKSTIDNHASGWEHNASIPVFNRRLKFQPWSLSAQDAQWLETRQFSVREVARWFGIPPHLLMETSAASNWGTGIEQQNLGLARFNLLSWTTRIEQALSTLLPKPRYVEFDFHGLERPAPEDEVRLILEQVNGGLITPNEGRARFNLAPVEGGNELRVPGGGAIAPAKPQPANRIPTPDQVARVAQSAVTQMMAAKGAGA